MPAAKIQILFALSVPKVDTLATLKNHLRSNVCLQHIPETAHEQFDLTGSGKDRVGSQHACKPYLASSAMVCSAEEEDCWAGGELVSRGGAATAAVFSACTTAGSDQTKRRNFRAADSHQQRTCLLAAYRAVLYEFWGALLEAGTTTVLPLRKVVPMSMSSVGRSIQRQAVDG